MKRKTKIGIHCKTKIGKQRHRQGKGTQVRPAFGPTRDGHNNASSIIIVDILPNKTTMNPRPNVDNEATTKTIIVQ